MHQPLDVRTVMGRLGPVAVACGLLRGATRLVAVELTRERASAYTVT